MAKAYLGKISALVTANTTDFNNKLNASAGELRKFAASVQGNITRATQDANKAFTSILTPLQKFEASLKAASSMRLSFKGFSGAIRDIEELKQRLTTLKDSQVNLVVSTSGMRSITEFRNAIADISNKDVRILTEVGGLEKVRELRRTLDTEDGRTIATRVRVDAATLDSVIQKFERIDKQQIDAVIRVLGEADLDAAILKQQQLYSAAKQIAEPLASAVSQFGKLSTEVQTAFIPALNRAQDATQNLQSDIEAGVRVGQERFRALEAQVLRAAEAIERIAEASSLAGRIRTSRELEFQQPSAAEALTRAGAAQSSGAGLASADQASFAAAQAAIKREADALVELIAIRERANEEGQRGTAAIIQAQIDSKVAALNRETAAYEALIRRTKQARDAERDRNADRIGASSPMDRSAGNVGASTNIRGIGTRTDISNMGRSSPVFLENRRGNPSGPFGPDLPPGFGGRSDGGIGASLEDASRQVDRLRSGLSGVKSQIDSLPATIRAQFLPAIQEAEAEFIRLAARGPAAAAEEIEEAAARVDRLSAAASNSSRFTQSFSRSFDDTQIRSFSARLEALRGILLRAGATAGTDAAADFDTLRTAMLRAAASGNFDSAINELNRLEREAVESASALTGLSRGAIGSQLQRAGDVGRAGFDKFSLALNQAAFAIDDFFSATGGLEFKIRAVSNNVTQLAFILGGTTGLFIGLAAVIGGQLLVAYDKFILKSDESKRRLESINDALSKQKTIAEELTQAYKSLADSIERSSLSRGAAQTREREREISDIRERQQQGRRQLVSQIDSRVGQRDALIAQLEDELSREIDRFKRDAIQAQIRRLRAQQEGLFASAEEGADRQLARASRQSQLTGRTQRAELLRGRSDADRDLREAQLALGDNAPDDAVFRGRTLRQYREALIEFDVAVQKLTDNAIAATLEINQRQASSVAAAQSQIEESFGGQPSRIASTLDFSASLRRQYLDELAAGRGSEDGFARLNAELSKLESILIQAAGAASRFADVLESRVLSIARNTESELASAEEAARRRFVGELATNGGTRTQRYGEELDSYQRLLDARRAAERRRQEIEQGIETARSQFEDEIVSGTGRPEDIERAQRIRRLDAQANSFVLTEDERRRARQDADRLRLEQQQSFEQRDDVMALRRRANDGDIAAQREIIAQESAARGRQLSMTPGQRAAEELDQQIKDIREYFSRAVENSTGLPEDVEKIREQMNSAIERTRDEAIRQVAPTITGLSDSVQNAILQGPSRAALNAADVTTMQGQQELNRLLRGDDPAKDVDLVALQREANRLLEMIANKENPVA